MRALALGAVLVLAAGTSGAIAQDWRPAAGATEVFNTEPGAAPGHRLVVTDLSLAPDAVGVTHYHPWEEYLYVIEGSAVLELAGREPRVLVAGESFVIPARAIHTPRAGPEGVRAIVTRVHDLPDPITVPVVP